MGSINKYKFKKKLILKDEVIKRILITKIQQKQ